MTSPSPEQVAAAVQGHIKALRLLGRSDVSLAQFASGLGLTEKQVLIAMQDFKIIGAKISKQRSRSFTRMTTVFSPILELSPRRKARPR